MNLGENYFGQILNDSNKMAKQGKEEPENDDPILTAYLLQLRAANWFANNPGSVLLNSSKYNCNSGEPLGGPINNLQQNYRNRQGSSFCSDEYPFWNCKTHSNEPKKVKIVEPEPEPEPDSNNIDETTQPEPEPDSNNIVESTEPEQLPISNITIKENFGGNNLYIYIAIAIAVIALLVLIIFEFKK